MTETAEYFRNQSDRCRTLAAATGDQRVAETLRRMAEEFDQKAQALDEAAE